MKIVGSLKPLSVSVSTQHKVRWSISTRKNRSATTSTGRRRRVPVTECLREITSPGKGRNLLRNRHRSCLTSLKLPSWSLKKKPGKKVGTMEYSFLFATQTTYWPSPRKWMACFQKESESRNSRTFWLRNKLKLLYKWGSQFSRTQLSRKWVSSTPYPLGTNKNRQSKKGQVKTQE